MSNLLVRVLGWPATLIHGDTLVLDRWRWARPRLPLTLPASASVLDVGCGSGAFTMGAARRGYEAVGLSWDERNQAIATSRANVLGLENTSFPICDVRRLDERPELHSRFDIALCFENIEHILDDQKLVKDIYACLKPGGRLLLTTPNYFYHPLSPGDRGPFHQVEDGGHVRRGYSPATLRELCERTGFRVEEIGSVSHYFSQRATTILRILIRCFGSKLGWLFALPLRSLPVLFDGWLGQWLGHWLDRPGFSITLVAYKPRFGPEQPSANVGEDDKIKRANLRQMDTPAKEICA
jgi:2-polyprenyl-3-methyl-5-hydroxy-6-metoxy-1,4-benzoquinol methylase